MIYHYERVIDCIGMEEERNNKFAERTEWNSKSKISYQILKIVQFGIHDSNRPIDRGLIERLHIHRLTHTLLDIVVAKAKGE